MNNYIVKNVKNKELISYLRMDPVFQMYSLHVCEKKPEAESLVAFHENTKQMDAVLITGKPDLYVAAGYYLTALNEESAIVLMNTIKEEEDIYLTYPLYLEDAVRKVFPQGSFFTDCMHIYRNTAEASSCKATAAASDANVKYLTRELFESLDVDSRFDSMVKAQELIPGSTLYGTILGKKLVSIGEHELENAISCGISQVYTLEEYRGKGYASLLIHEIAEQIKGRNRIPVYHFTSENTGSRMACEKAGFREAIKLGYMEMGE